MVRNATMKIFAFRSTMLCEQVIVFASHVLLCRGEERLQPTFQTQARQDVVGWLSAKDASESGSATTAAMKLLRGVAYELNEALGLGLAVPQQCMCACYGMQKLMSIRCCIVLCLTEEVLVVW